MSSDPGASLGGRLRRLLVCFDGSRASLRACELAIDLGKQLGAELTILSVLPDISHIETNEARATAERASRQQLAEHLAPHRTRAGAEHIRLTEIDVIGGDPADQIAAYALEHGFDLVIVGSHGQDRAMHRGPGRVVERLTRDPHCPVLVVPDGSRP